MTQRVMLEEVFIVDDEPMICELLSAMFAHEGYRTTSFTDGDAFLAAARERIPGFILLDVHMPGRSGLDLLRELDAAHYPAPIFMISGAGNVPIAVEALRKGAVDFIEKPFDTEAVVAHVRETLAEWVRKHGHNGHSVLGHRFLGRDLLTPRECEVLTQIAGGSSNKEAGRELGISPRTVEVHRARIMNKLGAKNAADLVRIVMSDSARADAN
jgi:FixJ family two-component response regulator